MSTASTTVIPTPLVMTIDEAQTIGHFVSVIVKLTPQVFSVPRIVELTEHFEVEILQPVVTLMEAFCAGAKQSEIDSQTYKLDNEIEAYLSTRLMAIQARPFVTHKVFPFDVVTQHLLKVFLTITGKCDELLEAKHPTLSTQRAVEILEAAVSKMASFFEAAAQYLKPTRAEVKGDYPDEHPQVPEAREPVCPRYIGDSAQAQVPKVPAQVQAPKAQAPQLPPFPAHLCVQAPKAAQVPAPKAAQVPVPKVPAPAQATAQRPNVVPVPIPPRVQVPDVVRVHTIIVSENAQLRAENARLQAVGAQIQADSATLTIAQKIAMFGGKR